MFYFYMSRLPGWGVYHEYGNLDVTADVEADGELKGLLRPEQKIPKTK